MRKLHTRSDVEDVTAARVIPQCYDEKIAKRALAVSFIRKRGKFLSYKCRRRGRVWVLRIIGVLLACVIVFFIVANSVTSDLVFAANVFAFLVVCAVFILVFVVLHWLITNLS